jgi:unsaturated rhamnogalacturonyl hydrolase
MNDIIIEKFIDKMIKLSKPDAPYWNIEAIKAGKKPHWNYIDGCMLTSLISLYEATKNKKYRDFIINYVDYYVDDNGNIKGYQKNNYSTDDICESRILFDLYKMTNNEKYLKAISLTYSQIKEHPRTKDGNFWHKKIYPNQVWLDGLFMALPFYTRYETNLNNKSNYEDIINQFKQVRKHMFNEEKQLYYHGYDASKSIFWADPTTGLSKNFWLRAIGWYAVAIVDVASYMDDEKLVFNCLKPLLKETIDGVLQYQDKKTHMFYDVIDKINHPKNYVESSGSALLSYAILKGVRLKLLDPSYQLIGKEIFDGIRNNYLSEQNGDLNLKGIVLVSGLGPENNLRRDGTFDYYMSEPIVENDAKGVGPLIMAYTELIKIT